MKLPAWNKTLTKDDDTPTCDLCGLPTNPRGCRTVEAGWYCQAQGLQPEAVPASPEPLNPAEQAAIDQYTDQIHVAQIAVDEATRVYNEATAAHRDALLAAHQAEVNPDSLTAGVLAPYSEPPNPNTWNPFGSNSKQISHAEYTRLITGERETSEQKRKAREALQAARRRLIVLQDRQHRERMHARTQHLQTA